MLRVRNISVHGSQFERRLELIIWYTSRFGAVIDQAYFESILQQALGTAPTAL